MISIIIPVYNTEKYLTKCIDSILGQSFGDFELILVDDGSTDSSGAMCDSYALEDTRVKVLHKENEGPSVARNYGVSKAEGECVTFIDSDDFVGTDYLEILHSSMETYSADISAILMTEIDEGQAPTSSGNGEVLLLNGYEALLDVLYQKNLDTTPCGMLIKKQIVLDNPFPPGKYHEDDFTTFRYFESADKVVINKCVKYYYVQHASSIMHSGSAKIIRDEIEAADNLVGYFEGKDDSLLKAARSKKFSNYCQIVLSDNAESCCSKEEYNSIINYLKEERFNVLSDKYTRFKNKAAALLLVFGIRPLKLAGKLLG